MNPAGFSVFSLEINYFRLVFEFRSINGAARKIGQDPANISRLIARLETLHGEPLFVRHRSGLHPTEGGTRLYTAVTRAQEALSRNLRAHASRSIHIGFPPAMGFSHFSPKILPLLVKMNMEPDFVIAPTGELIELLKQRKLDFALVANELRMPGLVSLRILSEGIVLASRNGKPQKTLLVHPDLLAVERTILTIRHEARWKVPDYFVLAKFLEDNPSLMGLLPESLLGKFNGLKAIRRFSKEGKLTALTWPGSAGILLIRELRKERLKGY